ncbi:RNA-directed DNA polymerase from mobile element jockey [Pitangus sulphuratus]|nr:RNA-directed DNA polymerase from mobile element jockey [Pitangus sulphuratus]
MNGGVNSSFYAVEDGIVTILDLLLPDLMLQLDPYKPLKPDGINLRILIELANIITKPLLMIFKKSGESGEDPADWKLANIVPVFKKGKKEEPRDYRPVSLTSLPGKLMEKIILGGIEKPEGQHCHQSQPSRLHEREALLMN